MFKQVFGSIRIGMTSPWTQKRRIVRKLLMTLTVSVVKLLRSQIGMVKSPVEGSTVALIRLQQPIVYSDFVRPICLPDDDFARNSIVTDYPSNSALSSVNLIDRPRAEKIYRKIKKMKTFTEDRQFFQLSDNEKDEDEEENQSIYHEVMASELVDEHMNLLKPEAQFQPRSIPYHVEQNIQTEDSKHQWKQCNTLGWSRQKEHLQRVQLSMIDMKACENISIATVNSMCAEAAYHKQDCNVSRSTTPNLGRI